MLFVLLISLIAGTCYGQDSGKYSDCSTVQTIADDCASDNLGYLETLHSDSYAKLKTLGELDDPAWLLRNVDLEMACNETEKLRMYYNCVYSELTKCLDKANSSQAETVPGADSSSEGVGKLCDNREKMNRTCIDDHLPTVENCISNKEHVDQQKEMSPCEDQTHLETCAKNLDVCEGGDVVVEFVSSVSPPHCNNDETGGASQCLVQLPLMAMFLVLSLFFSFM